MEKLYAVAFLLLPLFTQSQQIAYVNRGVPLNTSGSNSRNESSEENSISADEINKNKGRQVTFCSKVYAAKSKEDELGPHSVFYVGGKYVNEFVDIKIRLDDGYNLPAAMYKNIISKNVCIKGIVLDEPGTAAIYLDTNNLRKLVEEAELAPNEPDSDIVPGQELKVISNAYLLAGPKWKDPVITFLKAGSVIIAEQVRGNWAFVRVSLRNGENVDLEDIAGYINTKTLGLASDGSIVVPR